MVDRAKCPSCNGIAHVDGGEVSCAYPNKRKPGCLRDRRLGRAEAEAERLLTDALLADRVFARQIGPEHDPAYRDAREYAEETRAAVLAAMTVPEGFKLVPVEPTENMIAAGDEAIVASLNDMPTFLSTDKFATSSPARMCHAAMLAAAPEVPR